MHFHRHNHVKWFMRNDTYGAIFQDPLRTMVSVKILTLLQIVKIQIKFTSSVINYEHARQYSLKTTAMDIITILNIQKEQSIQVLTLFYYVMDMLCCRRRRRELNDTSDLEIISMFNTYSQLVNDWFTMITMFLQYCDKRRKKRLLLKPHLLMQIMWGYRLISCHFTSLSQTFLVASTLYDLI